MNEDLIVYGSFEISLAAMYILRFMCLKAKSSKAIVNSHCTIFSCQTFYLKGND